MRRLGSIAFPFVLLVLATALPAGAQTGVAGVPYGLADGSTFAYGCYGPCDCAVRETRLDGTFLLDHLRGDPLYEYYAVRDVRWSAPLESGRVEIIGSGMYRVGGEVALVHELILDVTVGGGPVQHFESGLVPGQGFPKIDIVVSLHAMEQCTDTVLHVIAAPLDARIDLDPLEAGLGPPAPNPFHDRTEATLALGAAGPVEARVLDAGGREVRVLAAGWRPAGRHALAWDGRSADGAECGAGVYFIVTRAAGLARARRVIKLR